MLEIIITIIILSITGFILAKSIRNSSKGKCNSGCSGCKSKTICSGENKNNLK